MKFAVDANFICNFQRERILDVDEGYREAINHFGANGTLILDEGQLCEQEWWETVSGAAGLNLKDWAAEQLRTGAMALIEMRPVGRDRTHLQRLGLPRKDHKWFSLCRDGDSSYFLTDDIDFFDPSLKTANEAAKSRARMRVNSPVRRHFRRVIDCEVLCCEGANELRAESCG